MSTLSVDLPIVKGQLHQSSPTEILPKLVAEKDLKALAEKLREPEIAKYFKTEPGQIDKHLLTAFRFL